MAVKVAASASTSEASRLRMTWTPSGEAQRCGCRGVSAAGNEGSAEIAREADQVVAADDEQHDGSDPDRAGGREESAAIIVRVDAERREEMEAHCARHHRKADQRADGVKTRQ